jgi:EmrB/QacA subfamily drug resistance transporter
VSATETPRHPRALAFLVAGALFMEMLDGTIIATALPAMARAFGVAPVTLNIGMTAYLLTVATCIPLSGWIADRFGARATFGAAVALFTLASVACGMSDAMAPFIAARVVQGVGGALMVPVGRLVVLRSAPREDLLRTVAWLTWPALLAPVIAPVAGGLLVDHASWRWIFYLNVPLGIVAGIAIIWLVPRGAAAERAPCDWVGALLWGGATILLVYALDGATRLPAAQLVAAFGAGGALLWASLRHFRRQRFPLLDFAVLRRPSFRMTILSGSLFRSAIMANPFLLPLFFQLGLGMSAARAGGLVATGMLGNVGMKPLTSAVLRRFGFRRTMVGNGLIAAAGFAICGWIGLATPDWAIALLLIGCGMARSMQFTALNTIAFADVPPDETAPANTLSSTFLQLNGATGVALGAVSLQLAQVATGATGPLPYRIAFVCVAAVMAIGTIGVLRLEPDIGSFLIKPRSAAA